MVERQRKEPMHEQIHLKLDPFDINELLRPERAISAKRRAFKTAWAQP
jgi:hypothetical protein